MTNSKFNSEFINSIIGAIGDQAKVTQNIIQTPGKPSPFRLPADIPDFTGRTDYIDRLEQYLKPGGTVAVSAVNGMGGVGKSALAIHVAHRLKVQFPDAQLYVDLSGQSEQPRSPESVLAEFLRALTGQGESTLPGNLAELAGMYRSMLAHKRALIVLDNARDGEQVRPLLPGSATCGVIMTSRQAFGQIREVSLHVKLETMLPSEGLDYLIAQLGAKRVEQELAAAKQIVSLCGGLPLALAIAGGTLKEEETFLLGNYAQALTNEKKRLANLQLDDLDVRSSFNLSYKRLTEPEQRLLATTGCLPGRDFGEAVVAEAMELEQEIAQKRLRRLVRVRMLDAHDQRRYKLHDLMRLFAREQLEKAEQEKLEKRVFYWYLKTASLWNQCLDPSKRQKLNVTSDSPQWSPSALKRLLLSNALHWFEQERENWTALVLHLGKIQNWNKIISLVAQLANIFAIRIDWTNWEEIYQISLQAAKQLGNRQTEGCILGNLALIYRFSGQANKAIECCNQSLQILRDSDDLLGESSVLTHLGLIYEYQGQFSKAIECHHQSLQNLRQLDNRYGESIAIMNLGNAYSAQGQWDEAIKCYQQSLQIKLDQEDYPGLSQVLHNLSTIYQSQGRWDEAIEHYKRTLEIRRSLRDHHGEGQTINNLGNTYGRQGLWSKAIESFEQSLQIFRKLGSRTGEASSLNNLGSIFHTQGKLDQALQYYEQSLKITQELGDISATIGTLNNIGSVYHAQGRWNEALQCHEQNLEVRRELGDRSGEAESLTGLGNIYKSQGQWKAAIGYYKQSLQISQELGDRPGEGQNLHNIGSVYDIQGEWRDAVWYYEQGLQIFRDLGDKYGEGMAITGIGNVYQAKEMWEDAIRHYKQSLEIRSELGDRPGKSHTLNNLGTVYMSLRQWSIAIRYYEQSLEISRTLGDQNTEGHTLANLGILYGRQGETEKLFEYWQEALNKIHPDSPLTQTVRKLIQEIQRL